jgi:dCMP deaminase
MAKMHKDEYYMRLAATTALRGTCDRRQVGAVLVYNDRILSTGFNGAPRGMPECDAVGHALEHGHCVRSVHAEANAILEIGAATLRAYANAQEASKTTSLSHALHLLDRNVASLAPVTIYTTTSPCPGCMNLIINAHVQRVVYGCQYKDASHTVDRSAYALDAARKLGIEMVFWDIAQLEAT